MTRIIMHGGMGRMGKLRIEMVKKDETAEIVA